MPKKTIEDNWEDDHDDPFNEGWVCEECGAIYYAPDDYGLCPDCEGSLDEYED